MKNIVINIICILIIIAILAIYKFYTDKKNKLEQISSNILEQIPSNIKDMKIEKTEEVTEIEKYNAIITLSNQMTLNNFLLFLILLILFVTLILPLILMGTEINKLLETINNLLNA